MHHNKELLQHLIAHLEHDSYGDDTRGMITLGRYDLDPAKVTEEKEINAVISYWRVTQFEDIRVSFDQGQK